MTERVLVIEDTQGTLSGRDLDPVLRGKTCRLLVTIDEEAHTVEAAFVINRKRANGGIIELYLQALDYRPMLRGSTVTLKLAPTLANGDPSPFGSHVSVHYICSCKAGSVMNRALYPGRRTTRVRTPEWLHT